MSNEENSLDIFDEDDNLVEYLKLTQTKEDIAIAKETKAKTSRVKILKHLIGGMFLKRIGKKNFDLWLAKKLSIKKLVEIANVYLKRKQMVAMLNKFNPKYKITNTHGLGMLINDDPALSVFLDENKDVTPHISTISEKGASEVLNDAKTRIEAKQKPKV